MSKLIVKARTLKGGDIVCGSTESGTFCCWGDLSETIEMRRLRWGEKAKLDYVECPACGKPNDARNPIPYAPLRVGGVV